MSDARLSQHPVDRLIREIIATRRPVLADEIDQIVDRIATAPFDPDPAIPVRIKHRGMTYQGHTLGARASALTYHLVKRVVDEDQWAFGTTSADYLADLREAARAQDGRLVLFRRRGGAMAIILSPNRIAPNRLGPAALLWIVVVFAADRGTIISGYQASSETQVHIPEDRLWLK
jgi:hypothetical protein